MATTSVGPIALQQINQDFYVGRGFLHTIQEAVDYAVKTGQPSLVIIPQGYYGGDQIGEVLRGENWIYVSDQRNYNPFYYYWNGTIYDGPFVDLNGKLLESCTLDLSNNHLLIIGSMNPASVPGNGANAAGIFALEATNGQATTGIGTTGGKGAITAIRAGHGGSAPAGSTNGAGGDLYLLAGYGGRGLGTTGTPGNVYIQDEENAPANVNSGNTFIGGHDQQHATMIQRNGDLYAPNLFAGNAEFTTALVDGSPIRTFENTGDPGTGMTYPVAGIAVSEGDAWGDSIDPTTVARLTGATFTGDVSTSGALITSEGISSVGGMSFGQVNNGMLFTDNAYVYLDSIGTTGNRGLLAFRQAAVGGTAYINSLLFDGGGNATFVADVGAEGSVVSYGYSAWDTTRSNVQMGVGSDLASPVVTFIRPENSAIITLWSDRLRLETGLVDMSGSLLVEGTIEASGAKNFRISHPLDASKELVHSCIEGPEHALFYRGEGVTKAGFAEIKLPDYFEKLTLKEDRTVQVTPLFEDEDETLALCGASRVKDGKFSVWSAEPRQKFYWEVKAIRADIPPLEVVRPKPEAQPEARSTKKAKR